MSKQNKQKKQIKAKIKGRKGKKKSLKGYLKAKVPRLDF